MRGLGFFVAILIGGALTSMSAPAGAGDAAPKKDTPMIEVTNGLSVSLEYTLSDDKGVQIETNKGGEPLVYTHGEHQIIPGLEKALAGLHTGQEKDVTVTPDEGYGNIDEKAFLEIEKEKIPAEALNVGAVLRAHSPDGRAVPVRVKEIKDKTVVIDFNHPMAGKTLVFHVKVLDVKKAEAAPQKAASQEAAPQKAAAPQQQE